MPSPEPYDAGQWRDELDHAAARAFALEARAIGNTGKPEEAAQTALRSWQICPTGEGARELAHWLVKLDRTADAIEYFAPPHPHSSRLSPDALRAPSHSPKGETHDE